MLTLADETPHALDDLLSSEEHARQLGQRVAALEASILRECEAHGITRAQYRALMVHQDGRCPVCRFKPVRTLATAMKRGFRLHLDSDADGVRGALCLTCADRVKNPETGLPWERRNVAAYLANSPFRQLGAPAFSEVA
jgi:hypothetical protein